MSPCNIHGCSSSTRPRDSKQWNAIFRSNPPPRIGAGLLAAIVEQARQESADSSTLRMIERRLASVISTPAVAKSDSHARIGTRIIRGWGGANHEVTVLPKGYSYRGEVYRSLSEIARRITGARWSGPRFFGTRERSA